ncbi:MAG TPA: hypothetical protein VG870_14515 [Chitinophagaceae bacterium]|nr:hypothetical protein [Chitinophagaceae bacterium]
MESFEKQAGEKIRLRDLVFQLLESYQPIAVQQHSYFLNEIPADCTLHTDRNLLATLLGSIFYVMARCGQETCIRVSAQAFQNDIFLEVKDTGTSNSYPVLVGLQHLRLLAAKMGGHVDLSGHRENAATILFSFPNLRGAA